MKITKITTQSRDGRYNIFVDDVFLIGTSFQVVLDLSLVENKELTNEDIEQLKIETEKTNALNSALNSLSRRIHSENELIQKLKQKKYSPTAIDYAIIKCKEYDYINDFEFAKAFLADKQQFKKEGIQKIKSALYSKGVSQNIIDEVFSEINLDSEIDRALELGLKKYNTLKNLPVQKQREKLYRYLVSKGFQFDTINKTYKIISGGLLND